MILYYYRLTCIVLLFLFSMSLFKQFIWVACLLSVVLATPSDFGDDEDVDQIIGGTAAPKGSHQYFVSFLNRPI